jgi:hypothetical protein
MFLLLSALLPVMAISGGCIFFLSTKRGAVITNAAKPIIVDDPSYDRPPDEAFWKWLPRSTYRGPQSPESRLVERNLGPYLVVGDLDKWLRQNPQATAASYFSALGMICKPQGTNVRCERTMAAWFVCLYLRDGKWQPIDQAARTLAQLRLVIIVANDNRVPSAMAVPESTDDQRLCPLL